jgi:hypothetical protein
MNDSPDAFQLTVPEAVVGSTPSLAELKLQTDAILERVTDSPDLIAPLQRLRGLATQPSPAGAEITVTQLAALLRQNPGLKISLTYHGCE